MRTRKKKSLPPPAQYQSLYADIKQLISEARSSVVKQVNQTLAVTYWQIGKGFTYSSLTRMVKFYKAFPEQTMVATLSQQFRLEAKND